MFGFKKFLLKQDFREGLINLFIHYFLRSIGTGLLTIFGIIYLYEVFYSVPVVLLFYFLGYLFYALLLPWGMKLVNFFGFKTSMIISLFLLILNYLSLYLMKSGFPWFWFVIGVVTFFMTIIFYWIPWHTDFAKLTNINNRAKNLAFLRGAVALVSIVLPLISSFIILQFGFAYLFLTAFFFILLSLLYLRKIPTIEENFTFSFSQTYRELLARKNIKMFWFNFLNGIQTTVNTIIWPLFIFILLQGNYLTLGEVTSLIILVAVVVRLLIGNLADRFSKKKIIRFVGFFHILGWIFKALVITPWQIFLAGGYHSLTDSANKIALDSFVYEYNAAHGHYIDEYSVLRDMALAFGCATVLLMALFLFNFFGLAWLFYFAALASLFLILL